MKKILIVDFGSQYTGLIARRIREEKVLSEIIPANIAELDPSHLGSDVQGIILSGGPHCSLDRHLFVHLDALLKTDKPVLGICFGFQLMAAESGGTVTPIHDVSEYGKTSLTLSEKNDLFESIPDQFKVWMSHQDAVTDLPESFRVLARSNRHIAAAVDPQKNWYGLQFHPEVQHTEYGREILCNFLFEICRMETSWDEDHQLEAILEEIRDTVGPEGRVIQAVSGGVDSTVASVLLEKAIPGQTLFVTVDTGLLRAGEAQWVVDNFRDQLGIHVDVVDYIDKMIDNLAAVTDPEKKRKIIGHTFIEAFVEYIEDHRQVKFLGQGTLYTDVIESVSVVGPAHTIKSHHNVGGLPEDLHLGLVEPLRMLYKDEVRKLGRYLEIPQEMLDRKPFPGPGLSIRIIGEVTREKLEMIRRCHVIVEEEIEKSDHYEKIWQSFPVLLNTKAVGVKGDRRSYDYVVALRIVESQDGMTAHWLPVENEIMETIANRLGNEVKGVGRVTLDLTSKPPGTIEWE